MSLLILASAAAGVTTPITLNANLTPTAVRTQQTAKPFQATI
jgi:hypothetical protein